MRRQQLITANFLPLARTENPQGFSKHICVSGALGSPPLGDHKRCQGKKQHGLR